MADLDANTITARARAKVGASNTPGYCLELQDQIILNGQMSLPPRPDGGFAYALQGWEASQAAGHTLPGTNAPAGLPFYFGVSPTRTDKDKALGDITTGVGGGLLVASDMPYNGVIGFCTVEARAEQTQRPPLGATTDFLGHNIANYQGAPSTATTGTTTIIPATTGDPTMAIKNLYLLKKAKTATEPASQSYLAESDYIIFSVSSSQLAALKKAYRIPVTKINENDFSVVNLAMQKNNSEMVRLVHSAS